MHVDYVTSPGARIEQLEMMWLIDYGEEKLPMDVLMIAGVNNIRSDSVAKFMERCHSFNATVMKQNSKNTYRVATLLMPPRLCWFEANGPLPGPGYDNQLEKVEEMNRQLVIFNNDQFAIQHKLYKSVGNGKAGSRDRAPMFHCFGVRFTNGEREHRMEKWREELPAMKLHLTNKGRNTMARAAQNLSLIHI